MSKKLSVEEQRKYDMEPVEGTFFYHVKPGCKIAFHFQTVWDSEPHQYVLEDKKKATLPRCIKEYINEKGYIEHAHKYLLDAAGSAIGVLQSTREQVYSFA